MDFAERVVRRLKLQDLHILMTVVRAGSMGKAAQRLNSTQPAISRTIAELEAAIGVRLLDRGPQGVEPTTPGRALLNCAATVFDDLRQGVRNIEFLSDPTFGEIKVGGDEALVAGLLSTVLERLHRQYPGITIHMAHITSFVDQYRELRERKIDLILGRLASKSEIENDIESEILYQDRVLVVAGSRSRWSTRRKINLTEVANEAWGLPPSDTLAGAQIREALREARVSIRPAATGSPQLLLSLLPKGPFLVTVPDSVLTLATNPPPLKVLPIELLVSPWPIGVMTLKKRTMSPVAQLFLDCAREVVNSVLHTKVVNGPAIRS